MIELYPDKFKTSPVDTNLLRIWGYWMHNFKRHRKHLMRIGHSTKGVDGEMRVLRDCIRQVHWLQSYRKNRKHIDN